MKLPPFTYLRAESIAEVLAALREHGDEVKILAGGQSLLPLMCLRLSRPAILVDINGLTELSGIASGPAIALGATVRHRDVEKSAELSTSQPLLPAAARHIGHAAIRTRGTVGGSMAHADPVAELSAVAVLLDAEIEARSEQGTRRIAAADFFAGFLTTSLHAEEMLTTVHLPALAPGSGWSFQEFSRRNGDFAVAAAAAMVALDGDGALADVRLVVSGVADTPIRAAAAERAAVGATPGPDLWREVAETTVRDTEPASDTHGSAAFRRHLAATLARRALRQAQDRVARREGRVR